MATGVYKITCVDNNNYYIGVSKNIHRRWEQHKYALKKNKHHSPKLQMDWDIYGEASFSFEIIKECEYSEAKSLEEKIIEDENPIYNMSDLKEVIKNKAILFEKKIMEIARPFITPLFYRGKKILMFEIKYLSNQISYTIIEILKQLAINTNGFNSSIRFSSRDDIYIGTLLTDDKCYITLTCADDGSSYKTTVKRIENPCV